MVDNNSKVENRTIHIAQVIGITGCGGVESVIMNYYKHIDRSKVQFDFLVESPSKIVNKKEIEALGGRILIIPSYRDPFRYMKVLTKIFKDNQYDIVHANMNSLSVLTLRAAKKAGVKIRIAHSHSASNKREFWKSSIKNLLRPFSKIYATHYFACSGYAAKWLFGKKIVSSKKLTILNNAIDIKRFQYNEDIRSLTRKELNLDYKFVVGHIGRFMPQKNHIYLIDIFNQLQKEKKNAVLLLIGVGPLQDKIKYKVNKLGLKEKVLFINTTTSPEKFYQCMDCFVLPSLYEGLPVVGVEAQINGLNCFLSDTITKEVKINGNVKFLSIKQTPEYWAKEILKLCDSSHLEGVQTEKFDITYQAQKLVTIYESMVKNNN